MPDIDYGLIEAALWTMGIGAVLLAFWVMLRQAGYLARNRPPVPCGALTEPGAASIAGKVAGEDPFPSPVGGIPSFCSRIVIEEWWDSPHGGYWRDVFRRDYSTPFFVEDGTGRVRVDPAGASLELEPDFRYDFERGMQGPPQLLAMLAQRGVAAEGLAALLREFKEAGRDAVRDALVTGTTRERVHTAPRPQGGPGPWVFARGLELAGLVRNLRGTLFERRPRVARGIHPLRVCEENLCAGDPVYVLGTARRSEGAMVVGQGDAQPWFMISENSPGGAQARMMRGHWLVALGGATLLALGLMMLLDALGLTGFA